MQRSGQDRDQQVRGHVDQSRGSGSRVLFGAHVGTDRSHHRGQRPGEQHVAAVEGAVQPRSPDQPVAGQHAHRRGGRADPGWKQQDREQAGQGSEVDLLLRPDLHRESLGQHNAREAHRDDQPAPCLGRRKAALQSRGHCDYEADQRHSDDDRLQPSGECGEGLHHWCVQLVGTSRVIVNTVPPWRVAPESATWNR